MESSRSKRRRLMQSYVPRRPDLPAIFESLNDDTLTTVLEFVGDKSYKSFGGINKHCREVYLSSGMTKKTFLFGYASLSVIRNRIERVGYGWELYQKVGKGVVLYSRRDVFEWGVQERKKNLLKAICNAAAEEGRIDLLNKVFNDVEDWGGKEDIFQRVGNYAARGGKLDVLKWYETNGFYIHEYECAREAAWNGQLHILQWLLEEKGLQLFRKLYDEAIDGGQLHVMKWLREQGCPSGKYTFQYASIEGNLEILQWLHDEGCPWTDDDDGEYRVRESWLKPEVIDWCRVNGYGNRIEDD